MKSFFTPVLKCASKIVEKMTLSINNLLTIATNFEKGFKQCF